MIKDTLIVDIQTMPDAEAARRLLGHPEWSDSQAKEALEDYFSEKKDSHSNFLRQPFHQVVAISYAHLMYDRDEHGAQWALRRIASGGTVESFEKELLEGFFHLIDTRAPRLVTFNGRSFALSVLKYRAMAHGLSCPRWFSEGDRWHGYDTRFSSVYHVDMLEVLSDYGASVRCSLFEIAAALDVPSIEPETTNSTFESSDVAMLRHDGENRVCSILLLFLRWQYFQGAMDHAAYQHLIQSIYNYLELESDERVHFTLFLEVWGKI